MELSIFLAKLFGLYLIVVCSAALINRKNFEKLADSLSGNLTLLVFSGAASMLLGLAVVISHNIWTSDWRVLISFLGWLTLFKAGVRLFFPEKIKPMAMKFMKLWPWVCLVFLIVGVYLAYIGFSY